MSDDREKLNQVLRPVAPPRILEDVYTDDQYERIIEVIKRNPWPTITAHHFNTVEELIATSNGGATGKHNVTLDDLATAHFRGILGKIQSPTIPRSRTATTAVNSSNWCVITGVRGMSARR